MRAPLTWLLAAVLVAGCGNAQKNAEKTPGAGASATNPGAAPSPSNPSSAPNPALAQPGQPPQPVQPPPPGSGGPIKAGSTVYFNFVMKADGKVVQDSHGKQPTPSYQQGDPRVFPALQTALLGLKPGDKKTVTLKPEEAFGPRDSTAIQTVPRANIPNADSLHVGEVIGGMDQGRRFSATVLAIGKNDIKLDRNHPLAGKTVTFEVEIVSTQ
ncbi:MAG: peptidylprolyl isomerase [bacterium]